MNKIKFSANRSIFIAEELTQEGGDRVIYQYEVRIKTSQSLFCVYYADIVYAGTIVADADWLSKKPNLKVSFLPCSVILPDDYSANDITFFSKQEDLDVDNDVQQSQMMESLVQPLIQNFKFSNFTSFSSTEHHQQKLQERMSNLQKEIDKIESYLESVKK